MPIRLLERDYEKTNISIVTNNLEAGKTARTKSIKFLIQDSSSPNLLLKDFSSIVSDIEALFQAILKISGQPSTDLIVLALDSGSDKSIDVVGIAGAVEKLSAFILEVWDRLRFARANKIRVSIKAASDGLTLLNELKASQEKGAISLEEAEKLKRTVLRSVDDLLLKGVYTRDMQESSPLRPNELEYQRTKLITQVTDASKSTDAEVSESETHLTQESDTD